MKKPNAKKLRNRKLSVEELKEINHRQVAEIAKKAVAAWWRSAVRDASETLRAFQRNENLKLLAKMPDWVKFKGRKNGYVMRCSIFNYEPVPVRIELNYEDRASGGLTYRELHEQMRRELKLPAHASMRICQFEPWMQFKNSRNPASEERALPEQGRRMDAQCTHLLGTTLLIWNYTHLTEEKDQRSPEERCAALDQEHHEMRLRLFR